MGWKRYVKKPVTVKAIQFTPENREKIIEMFDGGGVIHESVDPQGNREPLNHLIILTLEGDMIARPGDWIIEGVQGERYPCKPDIFDQTYEPYIK